MNFCILAVQAHFFGPLFLQMTPDEGFPRVSLIYTLSPLQPRWKLHAGGWEAGFYQPGYKPTSLHIFSHHSASVLMTGEFLFPPQENSQQFRIGAL